MRKSKLYKYGITTVIGAAAVILCLWLNGFSQLTALAQKFRFLADAFTIPGVIMVMLGFLVMVSNEGFFYGLSYAVSYAVKLLVPGTDKKMERYGDYVERKREKGKVTGYGFLFIVGGIFVALAVLFIVLFYTV